MNASKEGENAVARYAIQAFHTEFLRIRTALEPLQEQAKVVFAGTAPEFNIFRTLRLAHKEVITHSPLLASLFNPDGTHAQGSLFLQSLFDHLKAEKGISDLPTVTPEQYWVISTEQVTDYGNLDIVGWSSHESVRFVIENKIGAGDQPDQLPRYWSWMQSSPYNVQHLFYLTPNGRKCDTAEEKKIPYTRLSYHEDIRLIIEQAITEVDPPHVKETLKQYLDIVKTC